MIFSISIPVRPAERRKVVRITKVRDHGRVEWTMRRWFERYLRRNDDFVYSWPTLETEYNPWQRCYYAYWCWQEARLPKGSGVYALPLAARSGG